MNVPANSFDVNGIAALAVSPAEAARLMSIGRTKLYELLESGALRSSRLGNRRVITIAAINECLAAHEVAHG